MVGNTGKIIMNNFPIRWDNIYILGKIDPNINEK